MLEDLGFFVIDNLPPTLIGKVAELARGGEQPAALRPRRRRALRRLPRTTSRAALAELRAQRRPHPRAVPRRVRRRARPPLRSDAAAATRSPTPTACSEGIQKERALLEELKGEADVVVDTSKLNVHELRDRLRRDLRRRRRRRPRCRSSIVIVRLQARPAARRRPRVRLPLPAEPALGRRAAPARRPRRAGARLRARPARHAGVPRRARPAVRADAPGVRARGQGVPVDRASAAPAAGTAAS